MAHLFELLDQLPTSQPDDYSLPSYLLGSFRRKSISFFNGQTDEQTIVYWFQSGSFSIDLRLSDAQQTPVTERQGWIGNTLWNAQTQLLSWDIRQSYQTRTQWPEPARLYAIGNCILEFSPSHAYVEDWRQQADTGLFLGLRLTCLQDTLSGECLEMEGGLIITGDLMAYVESRFPNIQQKCQHYGDFAQAVQSRYLTVEDINQYETSVSLGNAIIDYSTIDNRVGQKIPLDNFELLADGRLRQCKAVNDTLHFFYYVLDYYVPNFNFVTQSCTSDAALVWAQQEQQHLFRHTHRVL